MTTKILIKRSSTSGSAPLPTDLDFGQIALNYGTSSLSGLPDGRAFYKDAGGIVRVLNQTGSAGAASGGSGSFSGSFTGSLTGSTLGPSGSFTKLFGGNLSTFDKGAVFTFSNASDNGARLSIESFPGLSADGVADVPQLFFRNSNINGTSFGWGGLNIEAYPANSAELTMHYVVGGSTRRSAIRVVNPSSGFGTFDLMRGGGIVKIFGIGSGTAIITGSLIMSGTITGSLNGSSSYALSASWAPGGNVSAASGSFTGSLTGSLLGTGSWAVSASWAPVGLLSFDETIFRHYTGSFTGSITGAIDSASYSVSSSWSPPAIFDETIFRHYTGSLSGSVTGTIDSASYSISASWAPVGLLSFDETIFRHYTGSLSGSVTGTLQGSSSYAITASYAANGGGSIPAGTVSSSVQVLYFTEERPRTPSPYNDEFDGPATASVWTQISGTIANYIIDYSRLLCVSQAVHFKQSMSIDSPMRIQLGITGYVVSNNSSAWIDLQGVTKGFRAQLYDGSTGTGRELWASRLSAAGVWEAALSTETTGTANQRVNNAVLTILIDSTNVNMYVGEIGSPRFFFSYARSNLGTLQSVSFYLDPGWSAKFFRIDRAVSAYSFPLDWSG